MDIFHKTVVWIYAREPILGVGLTRGNENKSRFDANNWTGCKYSNNEAELNWIELYQILTIKCKHMIGGLV